MLLCVGCVLAPAHSQYIAFGPAAVDRPVEPDELSSNGCGGAIRREIHLSVAQGHFPQI